MKPIVGYIGLRDNQPDYHEIVTMKYQCKMLTVYSSRNYALDSHYAVRKVEVRFVEERKRKAQPARKGR